MWQSIIQFLITRLLTPDNIALARDVIIRWLLSQVPNTANKIDDQVVHVVAEALGVKPSEMPK